MYLPSREVMNEDKRCKECIFSAVKISEEHTNVNRSKTLIQKKTRNRKQMKQKCDSIFKCKYFSN